MNLGIKHLSKSITPNTTGILWLTDEPLSFKTTGVYEFNYLLNGILIESLSDSAQKNSPRQNFFLGENFDSKFFIGHLVISEKKDISSMYQLIKLADNLINEHSQIFIYNRSKNTANINILKELSQKYPAIVFENLNI